MKVPLSVYDFFGYLSSGFALLVAVDYARGAKWLLASSIPPGLALVTLLAAYIIGHLVAHVSSVVFENWFLRRVLRSPEVHLLANARCASRWRWLFPGNFVPLPTETRERILTATATSDAGKDPRALFLHCYARVKSHEATLVRLNSFLNLYGFCRNMALSVLLSGLAIIVMTAAHTDWPLTGEARSALLVGALCLLLSYFLLLRYLKFFRHYTQEVFVSYEAISTER